MLLHIPPPSRAYVLTLVSSRSVFFPHPPHPQQRLQRLRSWSQDALHRSYVADPATGSSVDSTQPATLTTEEGGGTGIGGGQYKMDPAVSNNSRLIVGSSSTTTTTFHSQQHNRQSNAKSSKKMMLPNSSSFTSNKNDIISEPYLDEGEIKPLVYGYLYKLGRNGHWQRRFFETNGERLTYYKNVKRNTVLATLDLCKVRVSFCVCMLHSSR